MLVLQLFAECSKFDSIHYWKFKKIVINNSVIDNTKPRQKKKESDPLKIKAISKIGKHLQICIFFSLGVLTLSVIDEYLQLWLSLSFFVVG